MFAQPASIGKNAARHAPRDPGQDMALAATLVFFGMLPVVLFSALMVAQMLVVLSH